MSFGDLRDENTRSDGQKERYFQSAFDSPDINRGMEMKTSSTDILDGKRSSKFMKFYHFFRIFNTTFDRGLKWTVPELNQTVICIKLAEKISKLSDRYGFSRPLVCRVKRQKKVVC